MPKFKYRVNYAFGTVHSGFVGRRMTIFARNKPEAQRVAEKKISGIKSGIDYIRSVKRVPQGAIAEASAALKRRVQRNVMR